ncbi:MAG: DUF2029 domain-containing protein [Planctomycetota bacterium]|nr:DUF2029 domain-containing protein [Planctomycetota bacterium]
MADSTRVNAAVRDPLRWPMRVAGLLLLGLLVAYGFRCVERGRYEPPDPNQSSEQARKRRHRGTDFTAYYSAGEMARTGGDIYRDWNKSSTPFRPYLYPPMFAVFPMAPLTVFEHNAALAVYYALNVALLVAALWMLRRLLWPNRPGLPPPFFERPEVGLFFAALCCGRFLDANMAVGNANVVVLFLVTLGLYFIAGKKGAAGGVAGGLAVALATVYKVAPGIFGAYFFWSRRGWAMVGGAVGLALFLWGVPGLVLGFDANDAALKACYRYLGGQAGSGGGGYAPGVPDAEPPAAPAAESETPAKEEPRAEVVSLDAEEAPRAYGISLRGTFQKLFSETVALNHAKPGEDPSVNILSLDVQTATRLASAASLILFLLAMALTAPRGAREGVWGPALSFGLLAVTMLLVSPLTRKAHAVMLVLPAASLIAMLQQGILGGLAHKMAWAALLLLFGVGLLTSPDVIGDEAAAVLHAMGCFTWTFLFVYAAVAMGLWTAFAEAETGALAGRYTRKPGA